MTNTDPRYHWEHDGGEFYVVDRYGDPGGNGRIHHPEETYLTKSERRRIVKQMAAELNQRPASEPWDTIQADRDGYEMPPETAGKANH